MKIEEEIDIQLSKPKIILSLIGSLIFVSLGLWFSINPPTNDHWLFGNHTLFIITGLASVLFFGLVVVILVSKLSDKKPGLIISKQGIMDNSTGLAAGLIAWTDIQEIKISQITSQQKFLMLFVTNPENYLDNVSNPLKRMAMKLNHKLYGTPISISSNFIQTNFDDLHKLLIEKMNEYKK